MTGKPRSVTTGGKPRPSRPVKAAAPPPEQRVEAAIMAAQEVVEPEVVPVPLRPYAKPQPMNTPPPIEEAVVEYPVVYGNPRIPDEQFYVVGSPYRKRFLHGVFIATNETEELSVRAALAAHGRDKADKWRGSDRAEWIDRKTGFRTSNEAVKADFEFYHER